MFYDLGTVQNKYIHKMKASNDLLYHFPLHQPPSSSSKASLNTSAITRNHTNSTNKRISSTHDYPREVFVSFTGGPHLLQPSSHEYKKQRKFKPGSATGTLIKNVESMKKRQLSPQQSFSKLKQQAMSQQISQERLQEIVQNPYYYVQQKEIPQIGQYGQGNDENRFQEIMSRIELLERSSEQVQRLEQKLEEQDRNFASIIENLLDKQNELESVISRQQVQLQEQGQILRLLASSLKSEEPTPVIVKKPQTRMEMPKQQYLGKQQHKRGQSVMNEVKVKSTKGHSRQVSCVTDYQSQQKSVLIPHSKLNSARERKQSRSIQGSSTDKKQQQRSHSHTKTNPQIVLEQKVILYDHNKSQSDDNSSLEHGVSPSTLSRMNEQNPKLMNHLTIFESSPTMMMRQNLVNRMNAGTQHAPSLGDQRPDSSMLVVTPTLLEGQNYLETLISNSKNYKRNTNQRNIYIIAFLNNTQLLIENCNFSNHYAWLVMAPQKPVKKARPL